MKASEAPSGDGIRGHHARAEQTGTFLFGNLLVDSVRGFCRGEVHCWENAAAADLDRVGEFVEKLLD